MLTIKLSATASTNSFLKQWVQQSKAHKTIAVWAENQTQGRGRMGTKWHALPKLNLTGSVYVENISTKHQPVFNLNKQVCLALVDTLLPYKIPDVCIKWPNDILSGNKKIAGVLIEPIMRGKKMTGVVVGCGVNVNQEKFPDLPFASSIKNLTKQTIVVETLFESFVKNIVAAVQSEQVNHQRYLESLYKINKTCLFTSKDGTSFTATIKGITEEGKLKLLHENGSEVAYEEKAIAFTAFVRS